jgi:hypothetical protein
MAVYVFGSLKYRDAFKQDRFTNWRLIYTKPDASGVIRPGFAGGSNS